MQNMPQAVERMTSGMPVAQLATAPRLNVTVAGNSARAASRTVLPHLGLRQPSIQSASSAEELLIRSATSSPTRLPLAAAASPQRRVLAVRRRRHSSAASPRTQQMLAGLQTPVGVGKELLRIALSSPSNAPKKRSAARLQHAGDVLPEATQGERGRPLRTRSLSSASDARELLRSVLSSHHDCDDMLAELNTIKQHCKRSDIQFTDCHFRPTFSSVSCSMLPANTVTCWCRPQQIQRHEGRTLGGGHRLLCGPVRPTDWQLFRDLPRADDVLQGELGDCWFLASLAVLAEFEDGRFVRELFPEQDCVCDAGAYLVRLCLGGQWQGVLVDDRLPCVGGGLRSRQLAHCVTNRLQLWASLIEKAFAKACGSYEALRGGEASEALSMLTGWPCKLIILDPAHNPQLDLDLLWAELCFSSDVGFLMTCSTKQVTTSSSLAAFHVYSLLGVYDMQSTSRSRLRLLKIRNPHPRHVWNGRWSDTSPLWTPHLRQLVDFPAGGKSQVFCMELGDFIREFAHVTICRIGTREGYEDRRKILLPTGHMPCAGLTLEVTKSTECSLSIVQPNARLRKGIYCELGEHLASIGLVLCCLDGPRTSFGGERGIAAVPLCRSDSVSIDCWLEPGRRYLLVPLSLHMGSELSATAVCMC